MTEIEAVSILSRQEAKTSLTLGKDRAHKSRILRSLVAQNDKGYAEFVALPIEFEAEASLTVTATDIVFTQSDQSITFEGLGGVGGFKDPLDYFMEL